MGKANDRWPRIFVGIAFLLALLVPYCAGYHTGNEALKTPLLFVLVSLGAAVFCLVAAIVVIAAVVLFFVLLVGPMVYCISGNLNWVWSFRWLYCLVRRRPRPPWPSS